MKFFNTAGPVNQEEHYKIDPLTRWDRGEILHLIEQRKYFILHAPRQTGKTSSLLALKTHLNQESRYLCAYVNVEPAQTARNDVERGMRTILSGLEYALRSNGMPDQVTALYRQTIDEKAPDDMLLSFLRSCSELIKKPIILLIDEIDALVGDTLISVLRQLRTGYEMRPASFPQSILLCGVRDIKDYRIHRSDQDIITGGSCFNVKAKSLTLGNFSEREVRQLLGQHTGETGQVFAEDCFPLLMRYTAGQPWLVNALAYEVTWEMKELRDRSITITPELLSQAKERLVLSRATHLDQLVDKLQEDRVRRVIEPLLIGVTDESFQDDKQYCIDLGLIQKTALGLAISNEIYKEVIPRELSENDQSRFDYLFQPEWITSTGSLDTEKIFTLFQEFWRENSEIWSPQMAGYHEAAPHLTFQAFLQRVANGNGFIAREFAYGSKRADLMLKWKSPNAEQRIVIELKLLTPRDTYEKVKADALKQTAAYAEHCAATEAHIVVFDRSGQTNWKTQLFQECAEFNGYSIKIWGM